MTVSTNVSRILRTLAATAVGLAGAVTVAVGTGSPAVGATALTPYSYSGSAYGTSVSGGSLPASSGRSAFVIVSCTKMVGRQDTNSLAALDLGALQIDGLASSSTTYRASGGYHAASTSRIASVVAGPANGAHLLISGLTATAHAWRNSTGYHRSLTYAGALSFTAVPGMPAVSIPLPAEGQSVALPGLGTLTGGAKSLSRGSTFASASGYALRLRLDASGSTITLGRTVAVIRKALVTGVMSGRAFGTQATALGGAVSSGPTALEVLPCQGTGGVVRSSSAAAVTLPGAAVQSLTSQVRGASTSAGTGDAWTTSTVGTVDLGGQAVISGIRARAHVHRTSRGAYSTDITGTTPGTIAVNGQTSALPAQGTYEIPGVASIETGLVSRSTGRIGVVAVRVTLLSGTAANSRIDLGYARARIARG